MADGHTEAIVRGVALITLMLCMLGHAHTQDSNERDIESKLMALERLVRVQALSSKDLSTLNRFLSDEFVLVDIDGVQKNKVELLAYIESLDSLRYSVEEMVVRVHGDPTIVTGLFRSPTVQKGKPSMRQGRFL